MLDRFKIRYVGEKDLDKLAEVYAEVYRVFDVGEQWTTKSSRNLLDYWLKRQPDLCFLAESQKEIVGAFVAGIKPWWDGNHLVDGEIFVHPDHQGKGVGNVLSRHMYETAIEKYDATTFDTYTFRMTDFPLSWYKSLGFEEINEWTMISVNLEKALSNLK